MMDLPLADARLFAPATQRNRDAILAVLVRCLPPQGTMLEVASGTGEHAAYFASQCPRWDWQPSDRDPPLLDSIRAWKVLSGCRNLKDPVTLDVFERPWPIKAVDAVIAINLLHISPQETTTHLMRGALSVLRPGGKLIVYGPFLVPEAPTAASNLAFDASLREQDAGWGLRELNAVEAEAKRAGLLHREVIAMPANNLCCVWQAPER